MFELALCIDNYFFVEKNIIQIYLSSQWILIKMLR